MLAKEHMNVWMRINWTIFLFNKSPWLFLLEHETTLLLQVRIWLIQTMHCLWILWLVAFPKVIFKINATTTLIIKDQMSSGVICEDYNGSIIFVGLKKIL